MTRRYLFPVILTIGAAATLFGWQWMQRVELQRVEIRGHVLADTTALLGLARIESRTIMKVDPDLLADRLRRHPWVADAHVYRNPTGTVVLKVSEREPVALALDRDGNEAYWLDESGYRMPFVPGYTRHVPVFRGLRESYHPVTPIASPAVLEMLELLASLEQEQDALISEIRESADGQLDILTAASPAGQSVLFKVGRGHYAERLDRLEDFWRQAVLARPTITYEWVDLRFDQQIITRERA